MNDSQQQETDEIKKHPRLDNIMLRHHLLIQNILNNISLAMRNDEKIKFSIGRMTLAEDKIIISDLQFDNTETSTDTSMVDNSFRFIIVDDKNRVFGGDNAFYIDKSKAFEWISNKPAEMHNITKEIRNYFQHKSLGSTMNPMIVGSDVYNVFMDISEHTTVIKTVDTSRTWGDECELFLNPLDKLLDDK